MSMGTSNTRDTYYQLDQKIKNTRALTYPEGKSDTYTALPENHKPDPTSSTE